MYEREHSKSDVCYELSTDEMRQEIAAYCSDESISSGGIHYIEVEPYSDLADVGRAIECRVFYEKFGNDADYLRTEYGPYEQASRFYLAFDGKSKMPVGVLRAITADNAGGSLKCLDDVRSHPPSAYLELPDMVSDENLNTHHGISTLEHCWELGTIAILPEYRNRNRRWYQKGVIASQLIRAMYLSARSEGVEHMIAAMDEAPYTKQVKGFLGLPYTELCGTHPFEYMDSERTQLIYGHVPDFYAAMKAQQKTTKGRLAFFALRGLVDGKNDSAIHLPDDSTPRIYRGR